MLFTLDADDYSTPHTSMAAPIIDVVSVTPRTRLRTVRVKHPSKALLPPFLHIPTTAEEDALYQKVVMHTKNQKRSKIKEYVLLFRATCVPFFRTPLSIIILLVRCMISLLVLLCLVIYITFPFWLITYIKILV